MTKLVKLNENNYVVSCCEYGVYETCNAPTAVKLLIYCGAKSDAVMDAFSDFHEFDNNIADFGVMGGLTFTSKVDFKAA